MRKWLCAMKRIICFSYKINKRKKNQCITVVSSRLLETLQFCQQFLRIKILSPRQPTSQWRHGRPSELWGLNPTTNIHSATINRSESGRWRWIASVGQDRSPKNSIDLIPISNNCGRKQLLTTCARAPEAVKATIIKR